MKKINFLWLVGIFMLLPICLVSCSDDDEEGVGNKSDLVGTWESVSCTYQWKEDGVIVEEGTDSDNDMRIKFNEDGTYASAEYYNNKWDWEEEGTWNYKNGKITIRYEDEGESYSESATVKALTSSKLVIEYIDRYTEDGISYEDYALWEYRKISD